MSLLVSIQLCRGVLVPLGALRLGARRYASHSFQGSLNLPKTTFPTRPNLEKVLAELVPQASQEVYKAQLQEFVEQISRIEDPSERFKFAAERLFVLHDGPPYANGDLHLGHALNKVLKDIIVRYQLLAQGRHVYFKPGWDCHGLPIELKAIKQNDKGKRMSPVQIRSIARRHAEKTVLIQRDQFTQFGICTDWEDPYITMNAQFEINQLKVFSQLFHLGLIKRQNKPVYWGTETRTALAESELEYKEDHVSQTVYVKFPLTADSQQRLLVLAPLKTPITPNTRIQCLIWTSTPWTLFSNQAICYNDGMEYVLVHLSQRDEYLIISRDLLDQVGIAQDYEILSEFTGACLSNLKYTNPMCLGGTTEFPLLPGGHVTNVTGTGLVHTAPGHGNEDYMVGIQNNLQIYSPIDHEGNYDLNEVSPELRPILQDPNDPQKGRNVLLSSTTTHIIEFLEGQGMLFQQKSYTHSYPYDWRSKKPVIIRSTPQWFTNLTDIKQLALSSLHNVEYTPLRGHNRLEAFIKTRNEWCISRQRSWGVPIPFFQHKTVPDKVLMDSNLIDHVISVIERDGIDSWFESEEDISKWFPDEYKSVAHEYVKGKDTMDVWFDSGSSWTVLRDFYRDVLKLDKCPEQLANVYLEGSDQHRGWFQSSLLTRVASSGTPFAPFHHLITHGFILDSKGIKMSKSIGNVISPKDVIRGNTKVELPAVGVDGLRYFVAQSDFTNDITCGSTVMHRINDSLKKLRLTFKFLLGNLNTSQRPILLPIEQLRPVDKYILFTLQDLVSNAKQNYETFNFGKVLGALQFHLNNELSSLYFDICKDSLYCDPEASLKRRQIHTTLFHILNTYRALLAPILPMLVQEVWNNVPCDWLDHSNMAGISPMRLLLPDFSRALEESREECNRFRSIDMQILAVFKEQFKDFAPDITKPGQLSVDVYIRKRDNIQINAQELEDLLQVAAVSIHAVEDLGAEHGNAVHIPGSDSVVAVQAHKSTLHQCPRCWKYNATAQQKLCHRCTDTCNPVSTDVYNRV
ncbi:isoleucine--tRNA ligase ISM1 KNAG_0A02240 [Huiozyma naganishii CBS 8797]|uniref:isoleucine--tRNA ligase n=1 Tax=Huiozyma naganishii (strain ATCC MYA-139 / BCRC 22969 / CBS 8797 / KCTC 17520 / NBRC 10181 / NCYC 3082 / Yp74L-3) TaxID=1071383 RepID=J7RED3_HUIN7|nr:hypothetical protein KNAG_0A02240 [Kazachstania naganishii CBS 8797]CCK67913.1 hypothetical protein KNAG_0A02240 [Kazachstania naganishii CBS 8797]